MPHGQLAHLDRECGRWAEGDWLTRSLGNLQMLCHDCHAAKTRLEAGERARARRGD